MTDLNTLQQQLTTLLNNVREIQPNNFSNDTLSEEQKQDLMNGLEDALSDLTGAIDEKKENEALDNPKPMDVTQWRSDYYTNLGVTTKPRH
jgi:uncharacterized membrane protein YukC